MKELDDGHLAVSIETDHQLQYYKKCEIMKKKIIC
jgi:hypothetical protein